MSVPWIKVLPFFCAEAHFCLQLIAVRKWQACTIWFVVVAMYKLFTAKKFANSFALVLTHFQEICVSDLT